MKEKDRCRRVRKTLGVPDGATRFDDDRTRTRTRRVTVGFSDAKVVEIERMTENNATGRVRAVPRHAVIARSCTRSVRLFPTTVAQHSTYPQHHATMAAILPLHLPDHLPLLLVSTVGFAAIHHLAAPEFARFLLGKKGWDALGSRERVGWCVFRFLFPLCTCCLFAC